MNLSAPNSPKNNTSEPHLSRVRRICMAMPDATEKLSHGQPTFFARKKVIAMFADHHHKDSRVAVWIPAAPGQQAALAGMAPETYFRPPYVGAYGWVGIDLERIDDEDLAGHIRDAWTVIQGKARQGKARQGKLPAQRKPKVLT